MKKQLKNIIPILVLLLITQFAFSQKSTNGLIDQSKYLETIKVADNIYVFKPKIDWVHGNGVAIIGNDGVFFIDTFIQTNYAEDAIKSLKKITKFPVKFVLNTHWHYDHIIGNFVFKKAFPDCKFVMHDATYTQAAKSVKAYIEKEPKSIIDFSQLEKELKEGKTSNGFELKGNMRAFWEWQLREAKEYAKSYKGNQLVNADITFDDTMTFRWGDQTIQLIHAADNGHSVGDVIVWIPEKKLVVTGDIVVAPTPYTTYTNITGLMKSIQKVIDMNPAIIIPGHGEVQYDVKYPKLVKEAIAAYMGEAEKAADQKIPLRDARRDIKIADIDAGLSTANDETKEWAYRSFFINWIFYHVYKAKGALPTN